ncbi:pheromone processing endoprotease KexB [Polychytrium aggregatum]|uniref:pheromone processing endoprotease KexB n=1 Tax=Polychytrium aggregatum TaxID=110093 RepID=UPI0022FF2917|nr:pheromone processing endoprotease KexB [Polychytrium aggregatum]KAI9203313.1 pheromone processing endoprotease KexB [Polychytrium aggregatum]
MLLRHCHAVCLGILALALGLLPRTLAELVAPGQHVLDHQLFHYYAIQVKSSPDPVSQAKAVADRLGFQFVGRVGELDDYFLLASEKPSEHRSADADHPAVADHHARVKKRFAEEDHVLWVNEQVPKRRLFKRTGMPADPLSPRSSPEQQFGIKDPDFVHQWHLVNRANRGNDINVTGIWAKGYHGRGATVCFIDDGLDYEHPDLKPNFYAAGSYDYNVHTALPKPTLSDDNHGTRCAGEVAAISNDVCGVGIAWKARVSGVRILSGELTEVDEAAAINYDFQNNHIYSCSWGPADNGKEMDAPPKIVKDAVLNGIQNGRHGLGSIFVFASGNGRANRDNCNFDGYTNSIYTVTVAAIDSENNHPYYSEECSANMVSTYSSGAGNAIYTTSWPEQCTSRHGGTSAAAPIVSGIYALALGVRPELTWRDIQHLTVQTAIPITVGDPDWDTVALGRKYNHKFGFGKIDAYHFVIKALTHVVINPQVHFASPVTVVSKAIPQESAEGPSHGIASSFELTRQDMDDSDMKRLEHITVTVNIHHQRRGDVEVTLTSPHNVTSQLAVRRDLDTNTAGFQNWTFMTVKHWEEDPVGVWTLRVFDRYSEEAHGFFDSWKMTFWGESHPKHRGGSSKAHTSSTLHLASSASSADTATHPAIVSTSAAPLAPSSIESTISSASPGATANPEPELIAVTEPAGAKPTETYPSEDASDTPTYHDASPTSTAAGNWVPPSHTRSSVAISVASLVSAATLCGLVFVFRGKICGAIKRTTFSRRANARYSGTRGMDYEFVEMLGPDQDDEGGHGGASASAEDDDDGDLGYTRYADPRQNLIATALGGPRFDVESFEVDADLDEELERFSV